MGTVDTGSIGSRIARVRAHRSQKAFAEALGVGLRNYQYYERDERPPDIRVLLGLWEQGWNINWLLTGNGPEQLVALDQVADDRAAYGSQSVKHETLTIALQLASEALEDKGLSLPPAKRSELVAALYDLLEEGLPEAKVLRFARTAAA